MRGHRLRPGGRAFLAALVPALAVAALVGVAPATAGPKLVSVGTFDEPTYVTAARGDSRRVFVVERAGRVRLIKDGAVLPTPFLDITSLVKVVGPGGLLSIAFPSNYTDTRRFYALYTDEVGIRLVEFRASSLDRASASERRVVLTQPHALDHYGGQLQFGPDGYLYVSFGDGGDGGANAMKLDNWWGKLLRINPRASDGAPYSVPSSNPFVGRAGAKPEIWAYGLRNPWRFSFDRQTGDLVIGDVGEARADEIDFRTRSGGGGKGSNFGWNCFEGLQRSAGSADVLRNETLNPSFETSIAHWGEWKTTLSRVTSGGRYGTSAARLTSPTSDHWLIFSDAASGADVASGDRVLLRASVKRVAGPEPAIVILVARWYDASGGFVGGGTVTWRSGTTLGGWHELAGEIVVPSGVGFASVQVQFTSAAGGSEFHVDGAQAIRLAPGAAWPPYLDGSLTNGRWEGTAHDSRSLELEARCGSPAVPTPHVPPVLEKPLPEEPIGGWCRYSLTGGYVVRDPSVPSLSGRYLYGDFCSGEVRSTALAAPVAVGDAPTPMAVSPTSLVSFGEDASGRVYVVSSDGPVYRVVEAPTAPVGVMVHCLRGTAYGDAERAAVFDKLVAAGVTWVRMDVAWSAIEHTGKGARNAGEVAALDRCVDLAVQRGLRVLLLVMATPGWANGDAGLSAPPTNANDFKDFMNWAATRYRGKVRAWQLFNEPNNASFWTGSVADYVAVLKAGYAGVKAGDPGATVVSAGVMLNDDAWVRQLYANGAKDSFDALGVHPYQWWGDSPPETPDDGSVGWFTHLPAVRQVMTESGDADATIWITEFGYSAHENGPEIAHSPWATGVSEATQADYGVRAIKYARANWPYVESFFWYKERSYPLGESPTWFDVHVEGHGLLRTDWSERPIYGALKAYLTGS